jgi:ribosomal protein L9
VEVKPGYARNYLMPQKLAILFTKQQKKEYWTSPNSWKKKARKRKESAWIST